MKKYLTRFLFLSSFIFIHPTGYAQQIIRTIAGDGQQLYSGDGGPAISASIGNVFSVAVNDSGDIFSCDNYFYNIRRIHGNGIITTWVGDGYPGYTGDGGPCTAARLNAPYSLAYDPFGNLYIADAGNYEIRKIDRHDTITSIAGNHTTGYFNGDGIAATGAKIGASGIGFDRYGNMYIADGNTRIRKVNTSGIISTVAGSGSVGYSGDGAAATNASLDGCVGVCVDSSGNIYIADKNNNVVRKVTASTGKISTYAGTGAASLSGDGGQSTAARLNGPNSVRMDPQGNLVIADQNNCRIRKVDLTTGIITTIAGSSTAGGFSGDGGAPTAAKLAFPSDIAWDRFGNLFIADKGQASTNNGHRVREVFTIDTMHLTVYPSDTVCGYAHVTYTAHEVAGRHYFSFYKWMLNGAPVGSNSPTYFTDSVRNGDVITCTKIDTASGGFAIAVSDTIRMIVRPVVVPTVTMSGANDTLCAGGTVTLTATGTNGGPTPVFLWYKFDTLEATGPTFSYTPSIGDIIHLVMRSSAICAQPDSVVVSKAMIVNISHPPIVTLDPHPNDTIAYWGQIITIFTQLTYEGAHPTFQWYRNGNPIHGATTATFYETVYGDDSIYCVMYSSAYCVVPSHDTSNVMRISVGNLIVNDANKQATDIKVFPNPNNGTFIVSGTLSNTNAGTAEIIVTDVLGKTVYTKSATLNGNHLNAAISPDTQLSHGVYQLMVRYGNGTDVLHFVVSGQ